VKVNKNCQTIDTIGTFINSSSTNGCSSAAISGYISGFKFYYWCWFSCYY